MMPWEISMKPVSSLLAKTVLFAAVGIGLAACVATEPVGYYPAQTYYHPAPGYYYQPYYAPRPAYQSFYFSYSDRDDDRRGGRGRGHGHGHRGHGHR